jgi:hypothetical protein
MTTPMRFPKHYVALADFSLANSAPPSVYKYEWTNVALRWSYCDVEVGDMIKFSPTGMLTVYRRGDIVAQRSVTELAIRALSSGRGGSRQPKLPAPAAPTHRGSFLRPQQCPVN